MELFYFDSEGRSLLGVLHSPSIPTPRNTALAVCSPLFEEKVRTYRIFYNLATLLAERGFWVLRFDYGGDGDSEGESREATFESRLVDIQNALRILEDRSHVSRLGLIGLGTGGTLAALAAEEVRAVQSLVLWHPVLDVGTYFYEALRSNLANQLLVYRAIRTPRYQLIAELKEGGEVNVDGYPITGQLYQEVEHLHLCEQVKRFRGDLLLVELLKENGREDAQFSQLLEQYHEQARSTHYLSLPREFEWTEQKRYVTRPSRLLRETLRWLEHSS